MELKDTQSALILDADENGEINVEIAAVNMNSLSGAICQAIAIKLTEDVDFQNEIMSMLEQTDEDDES